MIYLAVFEEGGRFTAFKTKGKKPKSIVNYYKRTFKSEFWGLLFKNGTKYYSRFGYVKRGKSVCQNQYNSVMSQIDKVINLKDEKIESAQIRNR